MRSARGALLAAVIALFVAGAGAAHSAAKRTAADVLSASSPSDWRSVSAENTLYLELPTGRVIIELAPQFAPLAVANIRALAQAKFFDGLAVVRSQDNYVVQWGDAHSTHARGAARHAIAAEFSRKSQGLPFTPLPDPDTYAPQSGFVAGFPAARDPATETAWLTHCYGAIGVGRDEDPNSGDGTELYAVIGQAPRHLDLNITLVGRVLRGMELLSALPRGGAEMGFYEHPEQRLPIRTMLLASDAPSGSRTQLEVLRTDTATFAAYVEARRNRTESWFVKPAGRIDVCNVSVPVRAIK